MDEKIREFCNKCEIKNCDGRGSMRRFPIEYGGLGYCEKLKNNKITLLKEAI